MIPFIVWIYRWTALNQTLLSPAALFERFPHSYFIWRAWVVFLVPENDLKSTMPVYAFPFTVWWSPCILFRWLPSDNYPPDAALAAELCRFNRVFASTAVTEFNLHPTVASFILSIIVPENEKKKKAKLIHSFMTWYQNDINIQIPKGISWIML